MPVVYRPYLASALLIIGVSLAIVCLALPGTVDVDHWLTWMVNTRQLGPIAGYAANQADYPPLASVALWGIASLADAFGTPHFLALSLALALSLGLTTLLWLAWTRDTLLAALLGLALLINSVAHSYLDIFIAPPLVLALAALKARRWGWFATLFALTCLIKWQPLIIAPFLALYALRTADHDGRTMPLGLVSPHRLSLPSISTNALARLALGGLLPVVAALGLFGSEVWLSLRRALAHPYLSGNALNLNWVITHWQLWRDGALTDGLAHFILVDDHPDLPLGPKLLFAGLYAALLWNAVRQPLTYHHTIVYALAAYLAYFTFNTGVHENHLFLAVLLAAVLAWTRRAWGWFLIIALAANLNHYLFYGLDGQGPPSIRVLLGLDLALPLALLCTLFFSWFILGSLHSQPTRA